MAKQQKSYKTEIVAIHVVHFKEKFGGVILLEAALVRR